MFFRPIFQSCSLCSLLAVIYKSHYVQEAFTLHFIHPPTYNSLSEPFNCAIFLHLSKIYHCPSQFVFLSVYLSSSFYNCLSIFYISPSLSLCFSLSMSVFLNWTSWKFCFRCNVFTFKGSSYFELTLEFYTFSFFSLKRKKMEMKEERKILNEEKLKKRCTIKFKRNLIDDHILRLRKHTSIKQKVIFIETVLSIYCILIGISILVWQTHMINKHSKYTILEIPRKKIYLLFLFSFPFR